MNSITNLKTKDVVAGLGEIGIPIYKIFSKKSITVGYDINQKLVNKKILKKYELLNTKILHICIPFSEKFISNVTKLYEKFSPSLIVIHSTISPNTTSILQYDLPIPIIYSATRGVHVRMLRDLKRYTKFFAIESSAPHKNWAIREFSRLCKNCGIKTKKVSSPVTLELSKILVDTSYYGWLINYAQITNSIAIQFGVDYNEMWSFADEIHKYLGNRPKMYPGFIGGHCVIPNLKLMNDQTLDQIKQVNNEYLKKVSNAKSIAKKYDKS